PQELVNAANEYGHHAIAITDRNTLSGVVLAHSTLKKAKDLRTRFIVGCRFDLRSGRSILCYPKNRRAYSKLTQLLTLGRRRAAKGECLLDLSDVAEHSEDQHFVLPFPQVLSEAERAHIERCANLFRGNVHLALTHSSRGDDKQ